MDKIKNLAALAKPKQIPGERADADNVVYNIINGFMGIVGLIAVIVIIIGGYQYMTSTGDPGKVKKAKETILYGIIGLIVIVLAAVIVNFVIKSVTEEAPQGPQSPSSYTTQKDCEAAKYV